MSDIALTSIGCIVSYCVETTAGIKPTAGYTKIKGLKSVPDFNQSPSTGDGTTFENTEYTTKVPLLRELPDSLEFGAVFSSDFATAWEALLTAYTDGQTTSKNTWFSIDIIGYSKSLYFKGEPITMGLPSFDVNSVIESSVYIVPTGEPAWGTKPTYVS